MTRRVRVSALVLWPHESIGGIGGGVARARIG